MVVHPFSFIPFFILFVQTIFLNDYLLKKGSQMQGGEVISFNNLHNPLWYNFKISFNLNLVFFLFCEDMLNENTL